MKSRITQALTATAIILTASVSFAGQEPGHEPKQGEMQSKDSNAKPYPLETCIVSGKKLGEMGKPFVFEYEGQEIKLCCEKCRKDFDKDSAKYLKKLEKK
jgi:YHS domain-containing protein